MLCLHNSLSMYRYPMSATLWIAREPGSNRALIREPGEKWADDVNGEPNERWTHVILYNAYKSECEVSKGFQERLIERTKERDQARAEARSLLFDKSEWMSKCLEERDKSATLEKEILELKEKYESQK